MKRLEKIVFENCFFLSSCDPCRSIALEKTWPVLHGAHACGWVCAACLPVCLPGAARRRARDGRLGLRRRPRLVRRSLSHGRGHGRPQFLWRGWGANLSFARARALAHTRLAHERHWARFNHAEMSLSSYSLFLFLPVEIYFETTKQSPTSDTIAPPLPPPSNHTTFKPLPHLFFLQNTITQVSYKVFLVKTRCRGARTPTRADAEACGASGVEWLANEWVVEDFRRGVAHGWSQVTVLMQY